MQPDALSQFVERVRTLHARTEIDASAIAVLEAFEAADVDVLLLKGPALARMLYRADEHRGYGDIDLLVAPHGIEPARRILADLGFTDASARALFGVDDVANVQHAELWSRRGDRWGPVLIDLHWRLPGWEAPAQVTWAALRQRRASIDLGGRPRAVPDRCALALHLATHAAQHGPKDLKALVDLTRGLDRWESGVWRAAAHLADQTAATPAFAAGLRLVPAGVALACDLGLPRTDELTWRIHHRDIRPRGTFHLRALAEARGARRRLDVLRRSLLPTRRWIAHQHPWAARRRGWLPAGYAAHVLRLPWWAVRAWWFDRRARQAAREVR